MARSKRIIPAKDYLGEGQSTIPSNDLPPAGYSRNEELSRRNDDLQQKAKDRAETLDQHPINPKAFNPIREIQAAYNEFNELSVSNADPAFQYCWTNCHHASGLFVRYKLAQGWQVVNADLPEAMEHRHVDGTRRVGDVMLLRIRLDHWIKLEKQRKVQADRAMESASAGLRDIGEKYRDLGVVVHTPEDGTMNEALLRRMQTSAVAQARSGQIMDKWVREGNVPGMPAAQAK